MDQFELDDFAFTEEGLALLEQAEMKGGGG